MAPRKESRYWPLIDSSEKAIKLMHYGTGAAAIGSVISAAFSIAAICLEHPVLGIDGWGLAVAALFAVIAWRIYRLSLPWAVTGLALFTVERLYVLATDPRGGAGLIVAFFFFFAYLHSVRGGLYLSKAKNAATAPPPRVSADARYSTIQSTVQNERIEVLCPGCTGRLRIPSGRKGRVRCPRCCRIFEARS